jgi:hypothetical protein
MNKSVKNQLAKQLEKNSEQLKASFIDNKIELSDTHLKLISKYIGRNIIEIISLHGRKFFVLVKDSFDFTISIDKVGSTKDSKIVSYYPFYIQTSSTMYLIVVSEFDVYDVLNREPYHESIGEYRYQAQLARALGLRNAVAYDMQSGKILNEKKVVDDDLELMYCSDDNASYLIFSL